MYLKILSENNITQSTYTVLKATKSIVDKYKDIYPSLLDLKIDSPNNTCFILIDNLTNQLIGHVGIAFVNDIEYQYDRYGNVIEYRSGNLLHALEVLSPFKGKGYSNILMNIAIDNGAKYLWVNESNTIAINLYKKFNFKIVNKLKGDNTWLLMEYMI